MAISFQLGVEVLLGPLEAQNPVISAQVLWPKLPFLFIYIQNLVALPSTATHPIDLKCYGSLLNLLKTRCIQFEGHPDCSCCFWCIKVQCFSWDLQCWPWRRQKWQLWELIAVFHQLQSNQSQTKINWWKRSVQQSQQPPSQPMPEGFNLCCLTLTGSPQSSQGWIWFPQELDQVDPNT